MGWILLQHLLFLLVLSLLISNTHAQVCTSPPDSLSCVCTTSSQGSIDLSIFADRNGKDARLKTTYNGFEYLFNPCYGLDFGGDCISGTAVCQHASGSQARSCGTISSEQIIDEPSTDLLVRYDGGTGLRSSTVNLICDPSVSTHVFTCIGDTDLRYEFNLRSKCFCAGEDCKRSSGGGTAPGDIGIALMFLFVACVAGYFIFGVLLLRFHFHKEGMEMIPQKNFWLSVPGLIKDGCLFTFGPIINLVNKDKSSPPTEL